MMVATGPPLKQSITNISERRIVLSHGYRFTMQENRNEVFDTGEVLGGQKTPACDEQSNSKADEAQNGNLESEGNAFEEDDASDVLGEEADNGNAKSSEDVCFMTFDELELFESQSEKIELFNLRPYWPTPADIEQFKKKFEAKKMALFLNWLLNMNGEPETEAAKESYSAMHHFVNEHIILSDGEEPV